MGSAFAKLYNNKQNDQLIDRIQNLEAALSDVSASLTHMKIATEKCEAHLTHVIPVVDRTSQVVDRVEPIIIQLEEKKPTLELTDELRENIKKYMMENYNISWVSDSIEENVYDTILSIVFKSVKAIGL